MGESNQVREVCGRNERGLDRGGRLASALAVGSIGEGGSILVRERVLHWHSAAILRSFSQDRE